MRMRKRKDRRDKEEESTEEIIWYEKTVIWSRCSKVVKTLTFEHEVEDVTWAGFTWFGSTSESFIETSPKDQNQFDGLKGGERNDIRQNVHPLPGNVEAAHHAGSSGETVGNDLPSHPAGGSKDTTRNINATQHSEKFKDPTGILDPNGRAEMFGPFYESRAGKWGSPHISSYDGQDSRGSSAGFSGGKKEGTDGGWGQLRKGRSLVVLLQSKGYVYWSNGENVVFHIPFLVDKAWSISFVPTSTTQTSTLPDNFERPSTFPQNSQPQQPSFAFNYQQPSSFPPNPRDHPGLGQDEIPKSRQGGGLLVQRVLERREMTTRSSSLLTGMTSLSSALDDLEQDLDELPSLPRLYTLSSPFEEFQPISQSRVQGGYPYPSKEAKCTSTPMEIGPELTVLEVFQDYPLILSHDRTKSELVLFRRVYVSPSSPVSSSPSNDLVPAEGRVLPPIDTSMPYQETTIGRKPRTSLHRHQGSLGQERHISSADPLDRTQRRAPRMSRGAGGPLEENKIGTIQPQPSELQATLDPQPFASFVGPGSGFVPPGSGVGRNKKSRSSVGVVMGGGKEDRRMSGGSTMRLESEVRVTERRLKMGGWGDLRETTMMMGLERGRERRTIPIISTRPNIHDTIYLTPQDSQQGSDEAVRQLASSFSMMTDLHAPHSIERKVIKLVDPVKSSFTAIFDDEERIRFSAHYVFPNGLVGRCMTALSDLLTEEAFFIFHQEFMRTDYTDPAELISTEWTKFTIILRHCLKIPIYRAEGTFGKLCEQARKSSDPTIRRLARAARTKVNMIPGRKEVLSIEKEMGGVIMALHLVGQDSRLSSMRERELVDVAEVIVCLSSAAGRKDWMDYWLRLIPSAIKSVVSPVDHPCNTSLLDKFSEPPDILTHLLHRLTHPVKPFPSPTSLASPSATEASSSSSCCHQTSIVCQVYDALAVSPGIDVLTRASRMVTLMVRLGLGHEWIHDLPAGVAMPIYETMRVCQTYPDNQWGPEVCRFVGRNDLVADLKIGTGDQKHHHALPHVRFGSDKRLQEVERIMQTSRMRTIIVHTRPGASEQEIIHHHQSTVNAITNRTLSITVGQGIFEYGTRRTTLTDVWDIPLIELSVKIVPGNHTMKPPILPENAEWPSFHSGVSAALSISPDSKGIDSSWIVFNRPATLTMGHGGFLLGLGLTGHLRKLMTYHAFPYLEPRNDFISVGLLLGLACSYVGTEDVLLTKVLSLHTHALLPLGSMELNASPLIQSSALVGLGLLYVGSKNLRMAEVALFEIGRKTMVGVDNFADYAEAYSFSAAMAFGLIMLGRGGSITSEADRRILSQLRRCIYGDAPSLERSRTKSHVGTIDPTLTSSGATLALGFMYLKTNRRDIADMLTIPQTDFELEAVRPELLLLRTLSRALIMWEEVSPSKKWIEDQLPIFIQSEHKGHRRSSQMELSHELAYIHIISGACFAIGLKYAGTAAELAHTNLIFFCSILNKAATGSSMTYEGRIRRHAARQGLNVVTIALAVVMSGTGELSVLRRLRLAHGQEGAGVTYGTHMAMHMACGLLFLGRGHYTLGNSNLSIAIMAISFFPRFEPTPSDNRSYPQAFRHLWALAVEPRCLLARDVDTGETVYLLVKVLLKDENGKTTRQQNLISPTLIAPFESLINIEVDSPRYWPIKYDLSPFSSDRTSLVKTKTVFVKRKTGYLDYNTDPKGHRSIFVRAGSMTGIDMHWDLISPASPPSPGSEEVLDLVKAHLGDSALVGLSRHFSKSFDSTSSKSPNSSAAFSVEHRTIPSRMKVEGVEDAIVEKGENESSIDESIRTLLIECIALDKLILLPLYLDLVLYQYKNDLQVERYRQLTLLSTFLSSKIYDSHYLPPTLTPGEKRPPWIRLSLISTLRRRLKEQVKFDPLILGHYYYRWKWPNSVLPQSITSQSQSHDTHFSSSATSMDRSQFNIRREEERVEKDDNDDEMKSTNLAMYLVSHDVPSLTLLQALKDKVGQAISSDEEIGVIWLKVRDVAMSYSDMLEREVMDHVSEMEVGKGRRLWNAASAMMAISMWTKGEVSNG
ncbi:hypothetical protein TREMEDRAFT_72199 [Tremella mesenterica DSM 1558]|uniref:uncharacterized protein n=1 Tax=Tremella mesenterica (strain ATCC 24925 / CBS 8224 / DSM 1558 / NBRC 9311 / NRRL Y-6157 / RJB 2259-6 / UBC 559-6) TaxID=578456 RepID=UPI0003F49E7C|nr:uncharacterized protein TREMEDRAFT_72199 [Tremella mesenterica DSM 1558]EIW67269.1 hypothetical protein TREMEDRAFT_72199 [Tremella mesenterica DSM 1558]